MEKITEAIKPWHERMEESEDGQIVPHRFVQQYMQEEIDDLRDEIERINKCLKWEQNRFERIGTHGPGCAYWGPSHYECLLRAVEAGRAFPDAARAALEKARKE